MSALAAARAEITAMDHTTADLAAANDRLSRRPTAVERAIATMNARAEAIVQAQVENGARLYSRERILPRLLRPEDYEGKSGEDIIAALQSKLRASQNAIRTSYWAASPNRAIAFRQAIMAEERMLSQAEE